MESVGDNDDRKRNYRKSVKNGDYTADPAKDDPNSSNNTNSGLVMIAAAVDTKDWTNVSFDEGRSTLRSWREESVRRSEEVVELWEHVISRHPSSLADELWIVYEQVCIAALDCGRLDVAVECHEALRNKFPGSQRVMKLQAMRLEAMEKYDDALDIYGRLIEKDPTNSSYRKRRVAVWKAEGRRVDAIRELCEYLKTFLNDTEGWMELSNLYLAEGDYARAAHCCEELILSAPNNHLYHQRYAEIRYTQGGSENMELSKLHFSQAIKINPGNTRALYGLIFCCNWLSGKLTGQKKKDCLNLGIRTAQQLIDKYQEEGLGNPNIESHIKAVQELRGSLLATLGQASSNQ